MNEPAPDTLIDQALLRDPHHGFEQLRQDAPVVRTTTPDGAPVWLVTRYDDVRRALADPRLSLDKRSAASSGQHGASMPPELDAHMLNADPPDHTRLRRLVSTAFTLRAVQRLQPTIQQRTDTLLGRFPASGTDLMQGLAVPLAIAVICDLLGIAEGDRADFRLWSDTLRSPAADAALTSREAFRRMHRYLLDLIAAKRADPGDDLITGMIEARDREDRLSEEELVSSVFLLLFAGYDNSANLIGTTALALLSHPDQARALRTGALSMRQVVDEALRWNSPSMLASRRFALQDMTIAGARVRAGDRVWLSLLSANRDGERFACPADFRADRDQSGHLGFGHGLHHCLGRSLARLEAEVAVTTLLDRYPGLRLVGRAEDLTWEASYRNRGLERLPVTW